MSLPHPTADGDQRLQMRILLLEDEQLIEVAAQRLVPRITRKGLLYIRPIVADNQRAIGANIGKGIVDMRDLISVDVIHEVRSQIDRPRCEIRHNNRCRNHFNAIFVFFLFFIPIERSLL